MLFISSIKNNQTKPLQRLQTSSVLKARTRLRQSYTQPQCDNKKRRHVVTRIRSGIAFSLLSLILTSQTPALAAESSHSMSQSDPQSKVNNKGSADLPASIRNKTEIAISNYPLFLLSEAVTKGAPSGHLLLQSSDAGHHASLSPGDIKTIKDSRYVVWFGPQLESNLVKPFSKQPNTISLLGLRGFHRETLRDVKGQPIGDTLDPHIWLDPDNAKAITRALGALYSRANPEYKSVYAQNVSNFAKQMDAAVDKVAQTSLQPRPYWTYHDAFQYIEPTLHLNMVGAVTADHHLPPKPSQLLWLQNNRPQHTMCIVLQSKSNEGVLTKLAPIKSVIQQEDMSGATDFIAGWLAIARGIDDAC